MNPNEVLLSFFDAKAVRFNLGLHFIFALRCFAEGEDQLRYRF
jgi:hypothetical protein